MNKISKGKKTLWYYKKLSLEKKSVIWYAVSNILQKGVVFLTTPIITRLLTTREYGTYSVFLSWRDILIIFATLNLYQGVFTKILVDNKNKQDICTSSIQGLGWFVTICFTALYIIMCGRVNILLGQDTLSMLFLILYFLFFPPFSLWCAKQRVNYKYKSIVVITLLVSVLTPITSIILLSSTNLRVDAIIIGSLVIYIIAGSVISILNIIKGKRIYDKEIWAYAVKYNILLIPHYLSMIVLAHSDRIMIDYFCGEEKAGMYSLAYQISSMMNVIYIAINNSFVPRSYEMLKQRKVSQLNVETKKLLIAMGGFTLCAVLVAPELVSFMGGTKYKEAIYVIPPVCTALFVTFCYGFFNNIEFYFASTKRVMIASTVSAVSNIVLNWIFIPVFGYIAAGYTTLVSYIILALMHYWFAYKIGIHEFGKPVYKWKSMTFIIVVVITLSGLILSVYNHTAIRYLLVFIAGMLIVLKHKEIMKILKKSA